MSGRDANKRARFQKAKAECARLAKARAAIEEPFRLQMKAATAHLRPAMLDAHIEYEDAAADLPEFIGECVTCGCDLFAGDLGHSDDHGTHLCKEHAPTYGELLQLLIDAGPDWYLDGEDGWRKAVADLKQHDQAAKAVYVL